MVEGLLASINELYDTKKITLDETPAQKLERIDQEKSECIIIANNENIQLEFLNMDQQGQSLNANAITGYLINRCQVQYELRLEVQDTVDDDETLVLGDKPDTRQVINLPVVKMSKGPRSVTFGCKSIVNPDSALGGVHNNGRMGFFIQIKDESTGDDSLFTFEFDKAGNLQDKVTNEMLRMLPQYIDDDIIIFK